jgi:ABC-2 type transport system permease protein
MRVLALVIRIFRQFLRDKRTLALMMVAPLLIMWLTSMIFNGSSYKPKIGTVDLPQAIESRLVSEGVDVYKYSSSSSAMDALSKQRIDAFIELQGQRPHVVLEGSDPTKNKAVIAVLQNMLQSSLTAQMQPKIDYLYGSANMSSFDNFGPVMIGVFSFFFVFLIAGISFLKERTSGTLERLVATPLKRWEIVAGYVIGFGVFTAIQSCLLAWFAVDVLGMMMNGQLVNLLLVTLSLSLTALTLGIFLSSFANSEFQMMQFIPLVIVPQVFFSGLFSIDNMAAWMRGISHFIPLYYGADALRNVMIRGKGFGDIAGDLAILVGLSICFMIANVISLRKYRKV